MFYLVFLGLNCKLWNLVFRPIYGPCAKRTGHKTRSVKKKNCRFNLLQHWKAHSFKLQSVRIWQSLPLISEQPTVDLLFHSSMMGEMDETGWLNKALKQAKPQHACYSNQMCIWLIWLWSDGKVQQSSRWKRRERSSLFQTF